MELLGKNPSMQDLIEKLNEVVGNLNNSMPTTDSEIAEVKKLVSFGSDVLAGRLNSKLWYFKTQELMTASTELCEGDSCFVLNDGASTGDGTFEYWYVYKTDTVVDIVDSYVSLYNPDLVAVKLQDMTLKDIKERLSLLTDQSTEIANLGSRITNLKSDTEASLRGKADLVNGLVPAVQLPSYVDDIIEGWLEDVEFPESVYAKEDVNMTTPLEPESGKIYVNLLNNLQYRWGGSFFVEVSKSLAIGETSTTAFAGNRGVVLEEESIKTKKRGFANSPNMIGYYVGDIYDDYDFIPSSHVYVGNNLYILCASRTSNTGKVYKIDLATNKILSTFETLLYHANSCAFDAENNKIYVACALSTDENEIHTSISYVLAYESDFSNYEVLIAPKSIMGVSYDPVTKIVYAYSSNNATLYKLENSVFTEIGNLELSDAAIYNQDIAIYNNNLYISGYRGHYAHINLELSENINYGLISMTEGRGRWLYDENEGWEFDENGNLYCVMYSKSRGRFSCGFLNLMSLASTSLPNFSAQLDSGEFTATISDNSMSSFCNSEDVYRHPNCLKFSLKTYNTLQITTTHNFGVVHLHKNYVILYNFVCKTLHVRCSNITFIKQENYTISIEEIVTSNRPARIVFGGDGTEYDIQKITIGTAATEIVLRAGFTNSVSNFVGDGSTKYTLPVKRSIHLIGSVPDAVPICVDLGTITILANSSLTLEDTITLPSSYFVYRGVANTNNSNIKCSLGRTQTDNTLTYTATFRNESDNDVTVIANLLLAPVY